MTLTQEPALSDLKVLVVDDEGDIRLGLRRLVESLGADVREADNGATAIEALAERGADVVLTDLMMPRMSGAELLEEVKRRSPDTAVVILTGFGTIQSAVSCLQSGAAHFLTKPFDNEEVLRLVARLGRQVLARRPRPSATFAVGQRALVAEDPRMRTVLDLVDRVAATPVPVLIEGESGTGKELIARALHERSGVADREFLAVNTAALPDTLLESELFGHTKGAFTGADAEREGIFAQARGGTAFLDEVASMSPAFQAKLLRVLQEKVVRPLGADRDVPVDFRLLVATNRDLEEKVRAGEFREDLFYRMGVVRVHIPPLRERPGDILPMAQHFLAEAAAVSLGAGRPVPQLSDGAQRALTEHSWPGNARELENAMQRAVIVCAGDTIEPWHLSLQGSDWSGPAAAEDPAPRDYQEGKRQALEEFQREFVHRALAQAQGNVSRTAEECGLTRAALQRILRQLDIDPADYRQGVS